LNAQDRALALLACQRGLVDPAALRVVFSRVQGPFPQVAVREGLMQPAAVAALLRDLSGATFVCDPCRLELTFDQLAGRERMVCARCGGPLTCTPPAPTGSSGFARPVRPTGRVAPPPVARHTGGDDLDRYVSEDLTDEDAEEPPRGRGDSSSWGSSMPSQVPGAAASASRSGSDRTSPEGRRFGPYVIERELGRGSNGVVYLARRPGIDAPLALKVLRDADLADDETIKRFELEAAVAQKIRDPGIIAVFDVGKEGEARYFVMEYCAGKTLKERIAEGRVPPDEAAGLILAIARAMSVAHDAGVIHRDLKPANVIIDASTGQPRVTDFGLARDRSLLRSMTRTGDIIGTPFYMAPEQLKGEKELDHRIDIYALGVLLFECLTGTRPFKADTFIQLVEAATKTDVTPPGVLVPGTPRGLDAIVLKAMAREPRARYRTCHELVDDLERVLKKQVPRAPLPPRRKGDAPDRRVQVAAGVTAALVLALVALGLALRAQPAPVAPPPATETAAAPELDVRALRRRFEELTRSRRPPAELRADLEQLLLGARDSQLRGLIEVELRRARTREAIERVARASDQDVTAALAAARAAAGDDAALGREVDLAQGERLVLQGRFADALAALDRAAVDHGVVGRDAERARGFVFEKQGRLADARRSYAVAEDDTARGYCARAALKRLEGELPGADLNAQSALRVDPDHVPALLELARCRLERADYAGADAPIERARSLAPQNPEVHVLGALLKLREEKPESAAHAAERALALTAGAPDPDALVIRAQAAIVSRPPRVDAALADLDEVLGRTPEHLEALLWRGVVRHGRSDRDGAAEDWRHAWTVDRRRCERLAGLLPRDSAESFRRAVGLEPVEPAPAPGRPTTPTGALDLATAEAAAEALRDMFSSADSPLKEQLPPALIAALKARLAGAEQLVQDDLLKALVAGARGRPWAEVALPLKRAARFAEGASATVVTLEQARLLVARDRPAEALDAIGEARRLGVATPELDRLEADAAWRAGRLDEALTRYAAVAAEDPDGVEGGCAAAMALIIDGTPEAARAAAERALAVDATHAPSLLARAIALAQQGQPELVTRALEAVYARDGATSSALGAVWFLGAARRLLVAPEYAETLPDHQLLRVYDSAFSRLLAAECLLARRRPEKAELELARALIDRALLLEPDRAHAHLVAGRHALLAGRSQQDVLAAWRKARAARPTLPIPGPDAARFRERFDGADLEALLRR
jgi:tetratricopeptide (TPR) repeat protein/predicted Ser/Thr protein kinase